ncbi:carbohydrate kinase [Aureimonas endophytica]|uniref:Carbohydrate kinase n=1 Tax=Aureimonas endophytica TaxID=2027858 RepID=A0A917E204_9HYPH|nr:carbohydrate kinase family protein [Aureimonas endophytica]GGD91207.1 carbohydrate kinase [Aureimonas endophytica]
MNERDGHQSAPRVFAAGGAHVDRRGRASHSFVLGASNPGAMGETAGGAVFNAARALRRLGAAITLVSARGGDRDGETVRDALAALDLGDGALTWLDRRTPSYTAILDEHGDLVAGLADMALYDLMQPRVFRRRHIREAIAASEALLIDANLPVATIEHLTEAAGGRSVMAIGVSPAKVGRLATALPRLDALFLSRAEAVGLTGLAENAAIESVTTALAAAGCRRAVVTDGPRGAAILEAGTLVRQEPVALSALRDVTGAGDTLAGVACFALLTGRSFRDAARLGMAAASLHVAAERGEDGADLAEIAATAARMPTARSLPIFQPSETP